MADGGFDAPRRRPRLSAASLAGLPARLARPRYDRSRVTPGIVHLGLGAFARAHLAAYTEDALNAGGLEWGVLGANLNSPDVEDALTPQDCLYTLLARGADGAEAQVIGALIGAMTASRNRRAVIEALASADTRIVSLTVTEKGYCLDAASGELDEAHPLIPPISPARRRRAALPGLIVEALRAGARRARAVHRALLRQSRPQRREGARRGGAASRRLRDPELAALYRGARSAFPRPWSTASRRRPTMRIAPWSPRRSDARTLGRSSPSRSGNGWSRTVFRWDGRPGRPAAR